MLQIHTFTIPDQMGDANAFLATHKPAGDIHFQQDQMLIFVEDGTIPPGYEISEYNELLLAVRAARLQQQIALNTMEFERADLNMIKNKGKYEELSAAIQD